MCVCVDFEAVCYYWCWMKYTVVIPFSCALSINYNGDDRCAFIFVECMQRCRVRTWTNRPYVCIIGVWLNLKLLLVFDAV